MSRSVEKSRPRPTALLIGVPDRPRTVALPPARSRVARCQQIGYTTGLGVPGKQHLVVGKSFTSDRQFRLQGSLTPVQLFQLDGRVGEMRKSAIEIEAARETLPRKTEQQRSARLHGDLIEFIERIRKNRSAPFMQIRIQQRIDDDESGPPRKLPVETNRLRYGAMKVPQETLGAIVKFNELQVPVLDFPDRLIEHPRLSFAIRPAEQTREGHMRDGRCQSERDLRSAMARAVQDRRPLHCGIAGYREERIGNDSAATHHSYDLAIGQIAEQVIQRPEPRSQAIGPYRPRRGRLLRDHIFEDVTDMPRRTISVLLLRRHQLSSLYDSQRNAVFRAERPNKTADRLGELLVFPNARLHRRNAVKNREAVAIELLPHLAKGKLGKLDAQVDSYLTSANYVHFLPMIQHLLGKHPEPLPHCSHDRVYDIASFGEFHQGLLCIWLGALEE